MDGTAERYHQFAKFEAAGRSPLYEKFALHVAQSPDILRFLEGLPPEKRQPNLLFAAVRLLAGIPSSTAELDDAINIYANAICSVMLSRTTQTNEPGRCASLLPSLASIPGPLALIEVGASSGLCLLPDFYGYDWDRQRLVPPAQAIGIAPVFPCQAGIGVPLPTNFPEIVWRAGLDLNPLDVSKDDDVLWLENLVWPEHHQRLDRLRSAINIARQNPPRVVAGDLRNDLQALISEAPKDATVVVFHTAVLSYVSNQQDREDFARKMLDAKSIWISNESPKIFPDIAVKASPIRDDMFLLSVDGTPQAWCGPHGQSVLWI